MVDRLQAVADFFGIAYDTVRKDWRAAGMPGEHQYDLSAIARWKIGRLNDQLKRVAPTDLEEQKLYEEVRFRRTKNELQEEKLVAKEDVLQEAAMLMRLIADRLQAIPDELEMEIPSEVRVDVKRRWQDKVHLILKEMSEWEVT